MKMIDLHIRRGMWRYWYLYACEPDLGDPQQQMGLSVVCDKAMVAFFGADAVSPNWAMLSVYDSKPDDENAVSVVVKRGPGTWRWLGPKQLTSEGYLFRGARGVLDCLYPAATAGDEHTLWLAFEPAEGDRGDDT